MKAVFKQGLWLIIGFVLISLRGTVYAQSPKETGPIAFLSILPYSESGDEIKSAFDFLKKDKPDAAFLTFKEILKKPAILSKYRILWFHKPDTVQLGDELLKKKLTETLRTWIQKGNKLLLTLDAVKYLIPLGLETVAPSDSLKPCLDEGYGRKLGLHAFLSHPVFDSLFGGAYILRPARDSVFRITGYFGDQLPANGKIIAVDWDYIFLREDSKLMLEYYYGKGRVIAIGAYTCFSVPNYNRQHLELFMNNIFRYLSGTGMPENIHYWDYSKNTVTEKRMQNELPGIIQPVAGSKEWKMPEDPMELKKRYASSDFFDVAGERMLTMGNEQGGIEEIWAHPFMALRDYKVGIKFAYRDTIYWLNDERPEIEVNPASFSRLYRFPRAYLKEVIVNDPKEPSGVIHYEYRGVYDAELIVQFSTRMRLMWPYPETVAGSISYAADTGNLCVIFRDKTEMLCTMVGGNRMPLKSLAGQYSGFTYSKNKKSFEGTGTGDFLASGLMVYSLEMNDYLDVVWTATSEGIEATAKAFGKAIHDPYRIYMNSCDYVSDLLENKLMITSPDPDFNLGYRWSLVAADRFFVNTPGMGRSLVAGYSTTRKGWDGAQKVSGRPGYGWYFGRDGEWSGFALLDYGDFEKVKQELEFYHQYQDLSGKIFHEATTSGVIHYDAADATPLYIVLAGKYFRHTNDTVFLRESWSHIKRAIGFCFSTDTDHDHLIENTNVGHGWVEGGELYGSHATIYMQGCWAAALEESRNMAAALHLPESENYRMESGLVKEIVNRDFWDKKRGFFSYGMNKDGSFRSEPTVLPAVPIYFRIPDRIKAQNVLEQYAGNAFSTNWGTRIVRDDSPLFNPRGYHYGSVWPLFTGWTSLAEYAYGNYIQGFSHLMENLDIYKSWGLGFVEEVLNGSQYMPSGVCPHQCWSETMVLQPAIEGMLGLDINAGKNKVLLSPHFPADWDSVTVENIRMGNRKISFRMKRSSDKYVFTFIPDSPDPVDLEFFPSFPAGTQFGNMTMNGKIFPFSSLRDPQNSSLLATVTLSGKAVLELEYHYGISVLPVIPDPKPGYPSAGMRIISAGLAGDKYFITTENVPGTSGEIRVYCNELKPEKIENGILTGSSGNFFTIRVDFEPGSLKYLQKTVFINLGK